MENMDKGLTVPKWVLINCLKIPQMPQNYQPKWSAQAQRLHWVSVVRGVLHIALIETKRYGIV